MDNNTTGWDVCINLLNSVPNNDGAIALFNELKPLLRKYPPTDVYAVCTALTSGIVYDTTKTKGREKLMTDTLGQICAGVYLQDAGETVMKDENQRN